jgi:hypothetical protein
VRVCVTASQTHRRRRRRKRRRRRRERDTYLAVYPNLNDSSEGTEQSKRDRC